LAYDMNHKLKNGDTIKLVVLDTKGDKVESATAVTRLIEKDHVTAILGAVASSNSLAMAPVAEKSKTPMITHASTNPRVTKRKTFVSRACFIDPFQGAVAALYANHAGYKSAVLVIDKKQDYSVGLAKAFEKKFKSKDINGKILGKVFINSGDKDFNAQVSTIKSLNPDIVVFTGYYPEAALLAKQAKQQGVNKPMIGGDGVGFPQLIEIGGDAVEGFMYTDHFNEAAVKSDIGKKFVTLYHEKNKGEAVPSMGALAADAYNMILAAMNGCKDPTDKVCVNKNLRGTKNFEGITGNISLDERGDAVKSAVVNAVKGDKFVYKTTVNP